MVAVPTGYKIVISRALGMHGIYWPQPSGCFTPSCFGAINAIHPSRPWYNYYISHRVIARHLRAFNITITTNMPGLEAYDKYIIKPGIIMINTYQKHYQTKQEIYLKGLNNAQGSKTTVKKCCSQLLRDINIPLCHSLMARVPRSSFRVLVM